MMSSRNPTGPCPKPARSRSVTHTLIALLVMALSACGAVSTRPYVAGPYTTPQETLFQQLTEHARSNGYTPVNEDAARGRFVVQAHTTLSRGQTAQFVVQCYRPGWLQVTVEGPSIRRAGDTMSMPADLHVEYRDLTLALMDGLEAGRPAARSPR